MTDHTGAHHAARAFGHLDATDTRAADRDFAHGLAAVTEYSRRHGDVEVPIGWRDEAGFPLGPWVADQRLRYLEDRAPQRYRDALEAVPGWRWDPPRPGPAHGRRG